MCQHSIGMRSCCSHLARLVSLAIKSWRRHGLQYALNLTVHTSHLHVGVLRSFYRTEHSAKTDIGCFQQLLPMGTRLG